MKLKIVLVLLVVAFVATGFTFSLEDMNFSGQYRLRWQAIQNVEGVKDDNYEFMRNRIQFGMNGNVTDKIFVNFVMEFENTMGADADGTDLPRPAPSGRSFKLQQGYAQISDFLTNDMSITIGRQLYFLGRGFVLTDDWDGFDGLKLSYSSGNFGLDAVHYRFSDDDWKDKNAYDKEHMSGLIANYSMPDVNLTGYYLVNHNNNNSDTPVSRSDKKEYLGVIANGGFGNFRYYTEYIMQSGYDNSGRDYDASLIFAGLNYDIPDMKNLSLKFDYFSATGDDGIGDNNDFGSWRMYGYFTDSFWYDYFLDAFAYAGKWNYLANLEAIGLGFSFVPVEKVNVLAHYYMLSEEQGNDDYGDEIGVKVAYTINEASNVYVTVSQFMPDDSNKEDTLFGALQYTVNF